MAKNSLNIWVVVLIVIVVSVAATLITNKITGNVVRLNEDKYTSIKSFKSWEYKVPLRILIESKEGRTYSKDLYGKKALINIPELFFVDYKLTSINLPPKVRCKDIYSKTYSVCLKGTNNCINVEDTGNIVSGSWDSLETPLYSKDILIHCYSSEKESSDRLGLLIKKIPTSLQYYIIWKNYTSFEEAENDSDIMSKKQEIIDYINNTELLIKIIYK